MPQRRPALHHQSEVGSSAISPRPASSGEEGSHSDERLTAKDTAPRCGLLVVDTVTGLVEEWLRFEHTIDELYDVAVLPGVRQAEAIGLIGPEIERTVSVG